MGQVLHGSAATTEAARRAIQHSQESVRSLSNESSITLDDLEAALLWVSSASPFENSAFISRATGEVFYSSGTYDTEDELPEDMEDVTLYCSVPHKNDLDLGRGLALRFVSEYLPEQERRIQDYFHRRGAYARFKDLLERTGHLEQWHQYEQKATKTALLAWAAEERLKVTGEPPTNA
jgi:uncharacterized protein (DUF2164 family)